MAREATAEDIEELKALCRVCFPEDPPSFTEWVFEERFGREYITVAECEGHIACAIHALPHKIRIRDSIVNGALLGFVGTKPEYRGLGLMREAMTACMESLRRRGVAIAVNRPVELDLYSKLGHYPVADVQFLDVDAAVPRAKTDDYEEIDLTGDVGAILKCYQKYSEGYSLMAERNYSAFVFKCADYLSCDAKCIAVVGERGVDGYCIYFDEPERCMGEECVALDRTAYERLLRALAWKTNGKAMTVKLAPDVAPVLPGAEIRRPARTVAGTPDVSKLLPVAGFNRFNVAVMDMTVSANNGVFSMNGERSDALPDLRIEAGRLVQWICGYHDLRELEDMGCARVLDPYAGERFHKLAKTQCFIIDEY